MSLRKRAVGDGGMETICAKEKLYRNCFEFARQLFEQPKSEELKAS